MSASQMGKPTLIARVILSSRKDAFLPTVHHQAQNNWPLKYVDCFYMVLGIHWISNDHLDICGFP